MLIRELGSIELMVATSSGGGRFDREAGVVGCWGPIREEYALTRQMVLQLKGCARLLDAEPTFQRSIWLRNPYVDPIHLMQVQMLRRWRAAGSPNDKRGPEDDPDRTLFGSLVASVNGIAQGLQGTG